MSVFASTLQNMFGHFSAKYQHFCSG